MGLMRPLRPRHSSCTAPCAVDTASRYIQASAKDKIGIGKTNGVSFDTANASSAPQEAHRTHLPRRQTQFQTRRHRRDTYRYRLPCSEPIGGKHNEDTNSNKARRSMNRSNTLQKESSSGRRRPTRGFSPPPAPPGAATDPASGGCIRLQYLISGKKKKTTLSADQTLRLVFWFSGLTHLSALSSLLIHDIQSRSAKVQPRN